MKRISSGIDPSQPFDFSDSPSDFDLDLDLGSLQLDPQLLTGDGVDQDPGRADGACWDAPALPDISDEAGPSGPSGPTGPADPAGRDAIFADLLAHEGQVAHMYLDTRGYVTTGVGHLLARRADAEKLPWIDPATGQPASKAQIDAEFKRVHGMTAGLSARKYQGEGGGLVLPGSTAKDLANQRLDGEFLPALRRMCPDFDAFPPEAQRALVDMTYNLGTAGMAKFHKLLAACNQQDWAAAAEQCHRKGGSEKRNQWTHDMFLDAAAGASGSNRRAVA